MKIWIDLRFINDSPYSKFILQLLEAFVERKIEDEFIIYTNNKLSNFDHFSNTITKKVKIKLWSFAEQTSYNKILKEDNNNLMIFFNQFKPIFYKKNYIIFSWTLKDFYYSNFSNTLQKHIFFFLASKNFKNSKAFICLDEKTEDELIEKFNIDPEKISIINWFFPIEKNYNYREKISDLWIDFSSRYSINNDFFIYSSWVSIEKNYEKLISVFHKLRKNWKNIDLVFIWDGISSNLNLRMLILKNKMQKNVFFLGEPSLNDKKYLYNEALWVIFPSFYEPFPFKLTEAIYFNSFILASDLKKTKLIFWDSISYFSPISENSIYKAIEKFLDSKREKVDYSDIRKKYNLENSLKEFLEKF